ncbi:hypothetical protein E2C01_040445 [Portunus trituberculatus]|uniref:Uncharacterized protein n=1 Tax=Portunus trituberculatus TaxID=210409 RepID=A0A5B7FP79_PORTR|nr:hypothetical protein [Portunus trituberculatus]
MSPTPTILTHTLATPPRFLYASKSIPSSRCEVRNAAAGQARAWQADRPRSNTQTGIAPIKHTRRAAYQCGYNFKERSEPLPTMPS